MKIFPIVVSLLLRLLLNNIPNIIFVRLSEKTCELKKEILLWFADHFIFSWITVLYSSGKLPGLALGPKSLKAFPLHPEIKKHSFKYCKTFKHCFG